MSQELLKQILAAVQINQESLEQVQEQVNRQNDRFDQLDQRLHKIEINQNQLWEVMRIGFEETQHLIEATKSIGSHTAKLQAATTLQQNNTFHLRKELSEMKKRIAEIEELLEKS